MSDALSSKDGIYFILEKDKLGNYIASGRYKINENATDGLSQKLHSAIVMIITTPGSFYSFNPFKETIVFSDDIKRDGEYIIGAFNVNVSEVINDM